MHAQRYQQLVSASYNKGDDSDTSDDDEATYQEEEKEEKKGYYIEEDSDGVETGPNTWWSSLVI